MVADPDQTLQWVRETRGAAAAEAHTFAEWLEDPEVQRIIQEDMQQVAKKQGLKGFELARKVYFRTEQFTVENGLLTPTFKLKRHYAQEVSHTRSRAPALRNMYASRIAIMKVQTVQVLPTCLPLQTKCLPLHMRMRPHTDT